MLARRLLTTIALAVVCATASLGVPTSAYGADNSASAVAASADVVGVLAIGSYDCSLLPTIEGTCGRWTTTSAYRDIRVRYTWKRYNHAIGVKAVRCTGGDLGPWVKLTVKNHIYTLVSSISDGVCFRLKWGRTWASGVMGNVYY